jgi:Acyl-CoA thioesterase C-terminal domain/Acyl-CoA thioesterase N-terminal domain
VSDEAGADALFVQKGDDYVATELTQGPWNPEHQHGGPVCALLATVVETVPTLVPMRCGRLTVDLMRTVPVAPLRARAQVVREGKRVQLVEAALEHDGVDVARASALRVRVGSTPDALTHPRRPDESPPRAPEAHTGSALELAGLPVPGFIRALDMDRVVGGLGTGAPAITWYRLRVPVVAGEETSPLARLAVFADFTSGSANFLPVTQWSSINADVSMNVLRDPVGEWIAVDAIAHAAGDGIGHSRASFYDTEGFVGSGATTQVVDQVAAPFWKLTALGEVS